MEQLLRARSREATGLDTRVRLDVLCPAPGEPGKLEEIAPTCLLRATIEYERDVLFVRRRTTIHPSEKVFRDAIPRG